jgi:hypothetical protein
MSEMIDILKMQGLIAKKALGDGASRETALAEAMVATFAGSELGAEPSAGHQMLRRAGPSMGLAWLESAFPVVEVGHKLAASLMCTVLPQSCAEDLTPPWRCFSIHVPDGLLPDTTDVLMLFAREGTSLQFWSLGTRGLQMSSYPSVAAMISELGDDPTDWDWNGSFLDDDDRKRACRQTLLVMRLCIGVLVEMQHPDLQRQHAQGPRHRDGIGRHGEPASWVFRPTRAVKVDVRDAVRSFASGQRHGKLSLQHLVRGHHKRQACGPSGSERKWIHIEPYWRGDEDAPIAQRQHVLTRH